MVKFGHPRLLYRKRCNLFIYNLKLLQFYVSKLVEAINLAEEYLRSRSGSFAVHGALRSQN